MSDVRQARAGLITRILNGVGTASPTDRRSAFDNAGVIWPLAAVINKVATNASSIVDTDIGGVLASGITEDQVFELVVCAAVGQSSRQHDAAVSALRAATGKK